MSKFFVGEIGTEYLVSSLTFFWVDSASTIASTWISFRLGLVSNFLVSSAFSFLFIFGVLYSLSEDFYNFKELENKLFLYLLSSLACLKDLNLVLYSGEG